MLAAAAMPEPAVPQAEQEYLALLVHRGFLGREQALAVLDAAREGGDVDRALGRVLGWDEARVRYLRRTRAMQAPEIPGYEVGERLGAGGTSEVFAARRLRPLPGRPSGEAVALKILRPDLARDPLARRRFVEEAKLLLRLRVPGVVRGHRVFRFLDTYVLDMERVRGRTLEELLEEGRVFSEDEALDIVVQAARALDGLRREGVLHRDLKPGNLMVDGEGRVRIIDLGFAGRGLEGTAGPGSTLGTPAYLAPEQARGETDLDVRADIYSLGATLYHLVVGRLPFTGADDAEVMRKQVLEGLDGAALKGRRISPSLHYFIEKMMAKDREVRYATPAELAEDIEAHRRRRQELP